MKRALLILALAVPYVRADSLDEVLRRMDQAAQKFRWLSANVRKTAYTHSITDTEVEDGSFKMMKSGKDKFMLLAEFTGKDAYKLRLMGTQAEMYYPKAKSVQVYDTRKVTKSVDQYLFVGFGTSSAELKKTYIVTLGGAETIGGVKTTLIDLAPKSDEAKKLFNKIQLWIPDGDGSPIQEKIISGKTGKDYKLFQYSDRKIGTISDSPLPASDFELNLPADVTRRVMK